MLTEHHYRAALAIVDQPSSYVIYKLSEITPRIGNSVATGDQTLTSHPIVQMHLAQILKQTAGFERMGEHMETLATRDIEKKLQEFVAKEETHEPSLVHLRA